MKFLIKKMLEEKHIEALREVHEAIEEAIRDPRGLLPRQRRLVAMLSLGMSHLVELYFHRLGAIKSGAQIKHDWFKAESRRLKIRLTGLITKSIERLPEAERILEFAHEIELKRDDLVYGASLKEDNPLKEKIDLFLELKKAVESATGEIVW